MKKKGLNFKVFFLGGESTIRYEQIPLSPDLYECEIGFDGPYEAAPAIQRTLFAWTALQAYNPALVIIGGYQSLECWAGWVWARLRRRPIVMWYESNEFDKPRSWPKETLKRIFVSRCERAHVYGTSNKRYLMKLGMPEEHVEVKRAVVDVDKFAIQRSEKTYSAGRAKRVLFVGRLSPEKNLERLLEALAQALRMLGTPLLHLTVVGTGPLKQHLMERCTQLGIHQAVDFIGYCPQERLAQQYRSADFSILPSTYEPWGLVALEAMLCRVPVLVSTRCGCAADVVTSETGWTLSPFDVDEMAGLLTGLCDISAERVAEMGDAAHELAMGYSAPDCAARVAVSISSLRPGAPSGPSERNARAIGL